VKYIDKDGDTWESRETDDLLRCVERVDGSQAGGLMLRAEVENDFGPLRPVGGDPNEKQPSDAPDALPRVTDVMDRASVFQNAHALVTGLEWGMENPSVYDVLSVAKWLEGAE
jgi:hypothetical protein